MGTNDTTAVLDRAAVSPRATKLTLPSSPQSCRRHLGAAVPYSLTRPPLPDTFLSASGAFAVHYTRIGTHAAYEPQNDGPEDIVAESDPSATVLARTQPSAGAPSYIQRIAFWLETALSRYRLAGFPDPASRYPTIDVYVWRVSAGGTSVQGLSGAGAIDVNSQLSTTPGLIPGWVQHVCCHELFHLVQDMVIFDEHDNQVVNFPSVDGYFTWSEGLAELAPDFVNGWANAWMDHWTMDVPVMLSAIQTGGYETSILWRYLCDRFSNDSRLNDGCLFGADIAREAIRLAYPGATISWDTLYAWMTHHVEALPPPAATVATPSGPYSPFVPTPAFHLQTTLERLLAQLRTRCPAGADVYSDFLVANIVQDFTNASSKRRFGYFDHAEAPGMPRSAAIYCHSAMEVPLGFPVNAWAWRYYALDMADYTNSLHLKVTTAPLAGASNKKPNLQVVKTDGYRVIDIVRSTGDLDIVIDTTCSNFFPFFGTHALRDVFLIFAAGDAGVQYSIQLT